MMAGFFGGEGFVLQRLTGKGDAFVKARCGDNMLAVVLHIFVMGVWPSFSVCHAGATKCKEAGVDEARLTR